MILGAPLNLGSANVVMMTHDLRQEPLPRSATNSSYATEFQSSFLNFFYIIGMFYEGSVIIFVWSLLMLLTKNLNIYSQQERRLLNFINLNNHTAIKLITSIFIYLCSMYIVYSILPIFLSDFTF